MAEHVVRVEGLRREFRVQSRRPGVWGSVRGLVRRNGRVVRAIDDISFRIGPGELVGYVGANGAGKSTTIKVLAGILRATAGHVEVLGRDPHRHRRKNALRIGLVFGQRTQLWWDLPPAESFQLLGKIYRVSPREFAARVDDLVARLDLQDLLDVPVRKLSLGQRMRCELVAALLHAPDLVFLDEPTIGLDVVAKHEVRTFLAALHRDRGTTVILTSHDLGDIERLCTRVLVIDKGRILHDGDVESLRRLFGHRRVLVVDLDPDGGGGRGRERADVSLPPGARFLEASETSLRIEFDPDQVRAPDLIRTLLSSRAISDLRIQERPIEDVVARIYRGREGDRDLGGNSFPPTGRLY